MRDGFSYLYYYWLEVNWLTTADNWFSSVFRTKCITFRAHPRSHVDDIVGGRCFGIYSFVYSSALVPLMIMIQKKHLLGATLLIQKNPACFPFVLQWGSYWLNQLQTMTNKCCNRTFLTELTSVELLVDLETLKRVQILGMIHSLVSL